MDTISYAKNYTTISDRDIDIIMHCRKSLLFDNETTWTKKHHSNMFETMGSFDGAEAYRTFPPRQPERKIRQKQRRTLQRRRPSST